MSCWRYAEREPRGAVSATVSGHAPAANRAWAGSAPKPILAVGATTWCAGTVEPIALIAPGAAKSAPKRRKSDRLGFALPGS